MNGLAAVIDMPYRTKSAHSNFAMEPLVRPFDSDKMKAWRVDRRVNNVRNNEPSLIEPVKDDAPPEEPKRPEKPKRKSKADESGQLGMFGL